MQEVVALVEFGPQTLTILFQFPDPLPESVALPAQPNGARLLEFDVEAKALGFGGLLGESVGEGALASGFGRLPRRSVLRLYLSSDHAHGR